MEHDRDCEFKGELVRYCRLDFFTDGEARQVRAHMLCFCGHRRTGGKVTDGMKQSLVDRWLMVRDNYRDKVGAEEQEQARLRVSGGPRANGLEATVTSLADFRNRRNAESPDDARE
jgi:hypothetical protein